MSFHRAWWGALLGVVAIAAARPAPAEPLLPLSEALRRAEVGSPDVQASEADLSAARARARQAATGPNPEARLDVEGFSGSGPYRNFGAAETTIGVSQALELGGKRRTRAAAANAETLTAEVKVAIARADLIRDVKTRYAEAWAAQEKVRLAQDAVNRTDSLAKVAQVLVDSGREPPLRALRARSAAARAHAELQGATADLASARTSLGALWNDAEAAFSMGAPESALATERAPAGGDALDVRLAEAELATARAVVSRERALAVPDVTVEAGVRRYAESDDHAFVLSLSAPIPLRDRNQGGAAAARADATAAEVRRNQALAAAIRSERDARAALSAAEAQVAAAETGIVPEAEQALRLARVGYEAGKFGLLDVLDAETALAEARTAQVDARLARAKAQAALERALAR